MTNYICDHCGVTFAEDEIEVHEYREPRPYGESVAYEQMSYYCCPKCGSEDIEEEPVPQYDCCGAEIEDGAMTWLINGATYCEYCLPGLAHDNAFELYASYLVC